MFNTDSPRSTRRIATSRLERSRLRAVARTLFCAAVALSAPLAAILLVPVDPLEVDLSSWLAETPLAWASPPAPLVLEDTALEAVRGALGLFLGLGASILLWLLFRVRRLEWSLAEKGDQSVDEHEEFEALRARFDELVETGHDFWYRHDLAGNHLWVSEPGRELLGWSEEELAGFSLGDLLDGEVLSGVEQQLRDLGAGGVTDSATQELPVRTRDERLVWIEVRVRLVRQGGTAVAVEGLARNVTAERLERTRSAVERSVIAAAAEATSLNGALRGVLGSLCRELRLDEAELWWADTTYGVLRLAQRWRAGESPRQTPDSETDDALGIGESLPGEVWSRGESVDVSHLDPEAADAWEAAHAKSGQRRALALPVRRSGQVRGVIVLLSSRLGAPVDAEMLEGVGGRIAEMIEREETREALRRNEARSRAMLEAALDCILTVDHEGRVLEFNPASERTFGFARASILGERFFDHIVPSDLRESAAAAFFRAGLDSGELPFGGRRVEIEATRSDGTRFPVEMSIARIRVGDRPTFTAYMRDVTERKEVDRLKDELVSTVSHELRTPLASMRGFVELLLMRQYSPAESRQFLEIIEKEMKRLSKMIDEFLDIQRLEAGVLDCCLERFDIRELVEEATEVVGGASDQHSFEVDLPAEPLVAHVDPDRLRQVLRNLLSNAVKYSPEGGSIYVEAGVSPDAADRIRVSVRDEGIGMDQETIGQLFSKFHRADNSMTRKIGGTGLGLALVREIVTAHGGEVGADGTPDAGSTFWFVLPRADGDGPSATKPQVD